MSECSLCSAVGDSLRIHGSQQSYNRALFTSDNFVVMPCIGPLTAGHIMIVGKGHNESLAKSGALAIQEVKTILQKISLLPGYGDSLITEHGSLEDQAGGACIVHCHVHVIPEMRDQSNVLDTLLPYTILHGLEELQSISYPYIFTSGFTGSVKVYEAYNAFSQMMRKAICQALGRTDHDWKAEHNETLAIKTLEMWQQNN